MSGLFVPVNVAGAGTAAAPGGGELADQAPGLTSDGATVASSSRVEVTATASATPHTPGTWVEVFSSLTVASSGLAIGLSSTTFQSSTNTSTLLEIGTGAAGSETVWATLGVGYHSAGAVWTVPGLLAAGTRVAVRARSVVASKAVAVAVTPLAVKATASPAAPSTWGVDTATSHGTLLADAAATNTKSGWTQMVASTAADIGELLVSIQAQGAASMATASVLIDIGVGAAGSETVVVPNIYVVGSSSESFSPRGPMTFGVEIAAGSRISARQAYSSGADKIDLILVGA